MEALDKHDWKPLTLASLCALILSTLVAGSALMLRFPDTWAFYGVVVVAILLLLISSFIGALQLEKNDEKLLGTQKHPRLEHLYRIVILTVIQGLFPALLVWTDLADAPVPETTVGMNTQALPNTPDKAEDAEAGGPAGTASPEPNQILGLMPGAYLMFIGFLYVGWDLLVVRWGAPWTTFWRYFLMDVCTFAAGIAVLVVVSFSSTSNTNAAVLAAVAVALLIGLPIRFGLSSSTNE